MKNYKGKRGITLLALIITIIVLLILAGVAINILLGDSGIIKNAENVVKIDEIAREKENIALIHSNLKIEKVKGTEIDEAKFQELVDDVFGAGKANGAINEDTYIIEVNKSGNIYEITEGGNIDHLGNIANMEKDDNPGVLEGSGSETDPYTINSIEDLVAFSYNVDSGTNVYEGKTVALGRSLFFNGLYNSYADANAKYEVTIESTTKEDGTTVEKTIGYQPNSASDTTIKELVTTGNGFIPVGKETGDNTFKGTFDGKGFYLDELYINASGYGGLFGVIGVDTTIKNLGVKRGTIDGTGGGAGVFVGWATGIVKIEDCYVNNGTVMKYGYVGNFVGYTTEEVIIRNSYINTCNLNGKDSAGGMIGYTIGGNTTIENSHINNVWSEASGYAGGMIGCSKGGITVKNSYVDNEEVKASGYSGGIIGQANGSTYIIIENCYNKSGNVTAFGGAGGLIGATEGKNKVEVTNYYNEAEIKCNATNGGGLFGSISVGTLYINNSHNKGEIYGSSYAGGIIGCINSGDNIKILNTFNTASVISSNSYVAGVIGSINSNIVNIENCYNVGTIYSKHSSIMGGILGLTSGENVTIIKSYNTGLISNEDSTGYIGGIIGSISTTGETIARECYNTGEIDGRNTNGGIIGMGRK